MSLRDISKISIPILWTMHDLWPILGAEHHTYLDKDLRHKDVSNQSTTINKFLYEYKIKMFRQLNMKFVAPTEWIKSEIENSLYQFIKFPIQLI
jgi:hypothetical protein